MQLFWRGKEPRERFGSRKISSPKPIAKLEGMFNKALKRSQKPQTSFAGEEESSLAAVFEPLNLKVNLIVSRRRFQICVCSVLLQRTSKISGLGLSINYGR
jgi:hypothetical protein